MRVRLGLRCAIKESREDVAAHELGLLGRLVVFTLRLVGEHL